MKITTSQINQKLYSTKTEKMLLKIERKDKLSTGIPEIDNDFGFPTGYYVILGNPGVGKSWFSLWLSRVFYRHNQMMSVYFTLEMPEPIVRARIFQQWSDLTKSQLENGSSTDQAMDLMRRNILVVDDFYSEDTKHQTPDNFQKWIVEYYKLGYRVFHFDHLHELAGANDNAANQKVTEKWAKTFQGICKDYPDIWLFIYAQPNGAAANKKVLRRTDIAGSKAITQKCDYVMSLNRNFELDDTTGVAVMNSDDRLVMLYLDKTRHTESAHIVFKLYFSTTGNYFQFTKEIQ